MIHYINNQLYTTHLTWIACDYFYNKETDKKQDREKEEAQAPLKWGEKWKEAGTQSGGRKMTGIFQ